MNKKDISDFIKGLKSENIREVIIKDKTFHVSPLMAKAASTFYKLHKEDISQSATYKVAMSLCDKDGNKLYTEEDIADISANWPQYIIEKLYVESVDLDVKTSLSIDEKKS